MSSNLNRLSTKVFDDDTMFYDAEAFGTFTVGTHYSASVDLKAADIDELNAGDIIAKWPGLDSAGAMTVQIIVQDSADDSTFATLWTGPAMALATAQTEMADFRYSLQKKSLRRYVRIGVIIGTAVASAGALTAGLVK